MPGHPVEMSRQQGAFQRQIALGQPDPLASISAAQRGLASQGVSAHPLSLLLLFNHMRPVNAEMPTTPARVAAANGVDALQRCASIAFPAAMKQITTAYREPDAGGAAWPLPGTTAAPARGGGRGGARKMGHGTKAHTKSTGGATGGKNTAGGKLGRRQQRFQMRSVSAPAGLGARSPAARLGKPIAPGGETQPGHSEAKLGGRAAATGQAISQPKEVLYVPVAKQQRPTPTQSPGDRPVPPQSPHSGGTATDLSGHAILPLPAPVQFPSAPQCISFHNGPMTTRQMRKARHESQPLNYCVPDKDLDAFSASMETAMHDEHGRDLWMVFSPVRHRIPAALRQLEVQRFSGLEQRGLDAATHPPTVLGDCAVITPLTIALLGDHEQVRHTIPDIARLERNSFRLLRHTDLGGTTRVFLAYFVNRDGGPVPGVAAGHLEVFLDPQGHSVIEDVRTGLQLSADSLEVLVQHLERITGCHHLPWEEADTDASSSEEMDTFAAQPARSLFVDREEMLSYTPPFDYLPFNEHLDFFDAIAVQIDGSAQRQLLYRNSFTVIGNTVVYVDDMLRSGRLNLLLDAAGGTKGTLRCPTSMDMETAVQLGLTQGGPYTLQEMKDILRAANMLFMESPPVAAEGGGSRRSR